MDHERLNHARSKMIRYRILRILDVGRPLPVGEGLIQEVLVDADLEATQTDVRKAMQYLADKRFVEINKPRGMPYWEGRLLPAGVDYIENPEHDEPGIARPRV